MGQASVFTRSCDSLGHRPVCSLAPVGNRLACALTRARARARESSIVDVNKYPDRANAGRAGPLV